MGRSNLWCDRLPRNFSFLPDDTYVIPGHGEHTTIGDEKINNIYFKSETLARIRHELSQKPGKMKMLWLMIRSLVGLDKS